MKVFKFGGASVKNANAVKNVVTILSSTLKNDKNNPLIVVVSAMGKTTNLLESLVDAYYQSKPTQTIVDEFKSFHLNIVDELNIKDLSNINITFQQLAYKLSLPHSDNYHFEYDQIVSFGEQLSTKILAEYLNQTHLKATWFDAREVIKTNNKWREAKVNWELSQTKYDDILLPKVRENKIIITQGFIGSTLTNHTTTLGREGSDFSAAILAYFSNAESVTIWKDVPGMLNADPKYFKGTVLLTKISFTEAIELAYYGASVIHPKTIQPLKKKDIPLYIKSFIKPNEGGTAIQSSTKYDAKVASFIFKPNQVLLSVTPKDFSFIIEDNLKDIFAILSDENVRVNLMQNSAVSFSFLIDDKYNLQQIITHFKNDYLVKYNQNVELLTVRHYDDDTLERLTNGKQILLEQKTRQTARIVLG
ncbi:MAG TPA: aspartate kinase [Crocinitomix sp.]|nr:aspartate kinase [Crocinitomix sp.]